MVGEVGERTSGGRQTQAVPQSPKESRGEMRRNRASLKAHYGGASLARDWRAGVQNCCE